MKLQAEAVFPADHPALPGHFPGEPIVPGVVILDELRAIIEAWQTGFWVSAVAQAKFTTPLFPGERLIIELTANGNECRFKCRKGDTPVAQGFFRLTSLS